MKACYSVYVHIFPDGCQYVGITKQGAERRWRNGNGYSKHSRLGVAIQKYGWINVLHLILFDSITREEAEILEMQLIATGELTCPEYGYNVSAGGGLPPPCTEATRAKISAARRGKTLSAEHREKIRKANLGRKHTAEVLLRISSTKKERMTKELRAKLSEASKKRMTPTARAKIGVANRGRVCTPEARERQRISHLGYIPSAEQRAKISAANLGKTRTPEARAKMRAAKLGKTHTPESRARMCVAQRLWRSALKDETTPRKGGEST